MLQNPDESQDKAARRAARKAAALVKRHMSTLPPEQAAEVDRRAKEAARRAAQLVKAAGPNILYVLQEPVDILNPDRVISAHELLAWQHRTRGIKIGFGPPPTSNFSNPALNESFIFAATFSPGRIYAIQKSSGITKWIHKLDYYGKTPVAAEDCLIVNDCTSLASLNPNTGDVQWKFKPYKRQGDDINSTSVICDGSVYVGDSQGWFWCLSADTGAPKWSVQTSPSLNSNVYATALVFEHLVITANNEKLVLAYDRSSGEEVWRQLLPFNTIYQIQLFDGMALVQTPETLYGLSPRTGSVLQEWTWPGHEIISVAVSNSVLCVVLTNEPGVRDRVLPDHPTTELVGVQGDKTLWRLPYPRYSGIDLRWDTTTGLLYESMYIGLGIVDANSGRRVAVINGFDEDSYSNDVSLPGMDTEHIYLIDRLGTICALRHPMLTAV